MGHAPGNPPRILVVGGGYVGMYTALGLQSQLRPGDASVTVVDPQLQMTYQPFLPGAAAGSVEPRHVVVPLREVLTGCRVVCGRVTSVAHAHRFATIENCAGQLEQLDYDVLVMAPGSIARMLPIPGLAEHGIAVKTIGEAIYLRNHVLSRLEVANATSEVRLRRKLLSFVVIGGGYAGIEVLGELEEMARHASHYYQRIEPADLRWVLVEAGDRIMPEVSPKLSRYTARQLTHRGIEIFLNTRVTTMENGHLVLDEGTEFDADTIVWTTGVKANPMVQQTDLPLDGHHRVRCKATLQVVGCPDAFAAGDCAAVPDLSAREPGALCSPSAHHALRQAGLLADNVIACLRGQGLRHYRHRYAGSVASLGLYRGVAEIHGIRFTGVVAWLMHRAYHLRRVPTLNRKVRILIDWTGALLFRHEAVALGQVDDPQAESVRATTGS
ncbi:MAG TPA: NAD(P)/FAD-dependent oxidoreductase [Pseudonocardiaceae bacterium]